MEFKCANMTINGCERMDVVKDMILTEIKESNPIWCTIEVCKEMCCLDCDRENCTYRCNRCGWPDEMLQIKSHDEELETERLLGIRCYNCLEIINQQGHCFKVLGAEVDELWICQSCYDKIPKKTNEELSEEFKKSEIKEIEYEQISFL